MANQRNPHWSYLCPQAACRAWSRICPSSFPTSSSVCLIKKPWCGPSLAGHWVDMPTGLSVSLRIHTWSLWWRSCSSVSWTVTSVCRRLLAGKQLAYTIQCWISSHRLAVTVTHDPLLSSCSPSQCICHFGGGSLHRAGALSGIHPGHTGVCVQQVPTQKSAHSLRRHRNARGFCGAPSQQTSMQIEISAWILICFRRDFSGLFFLRNTFRCWCLHWSRSGTNWKMKTKISFRY